jgi:hypothetical protein
MNSVSKIGNIFWYMMERCNCRVQDFIYFLSPSEMIYINFLVNVKQLF